ncbi:MAG: hypothetical protein QOK23_4686 [Gammaproteobacteria bacterium]|jgi:hypothetical protein|nr:hypothetical protein [Gammaproteobacteria bacterium]MEA3142517.1 hypothetical protein [Gammaproteobacteria bacterium]
MTFDSKLLSGLTVLIAVVEAGTIARLLLRTTGSRFPEVPEVAMDLIDRPDQVPWVPFRPSKVLAAIKKS